MERDAPTTGTAEAESTRTGTRTSTRMPAIELITRGEPRRRWSVEQKQAIAAESLMPGASATVIARRYGISSGLLYAWRKALLATQPAPGPRFARVDVVEERRRSPAALISPPSPSPATPQPTEVIEIVLPNGTTLRVPSQIDPRALRSLLSVFQR
jgi:transposase